MKLTVVVPTYNRAPVLAKCLEALSRQTYPGNDFEVVVSDDGSSDDTAQTAARFPVRYLHQTNSGANRARNHAVRTSTAPLLLFINDDVIPSPRMIAEHLATHAHTRTGGSRYSAV